MAHIKHQGLVYLAARAQSISNGRFYIISVNLEFFLVCFNAVCEDNCAYIKYYTSACNSSGTVCATIIVLFSFFSNCAANSAEV